MKIIEKFKKLSKRNKILLLIGLVLIAILLSKTLGSKKEAVTYKTEKVKKGNVVSLVSETGEILTSGKADINSTITGVVEEVYVKNQDMVKSGQSLFKVKSTASQAEKSTAYSSYLGVKKYSGISQVCSIYTSIKFFFSQPKIYKRCRCS